MIFTKIRDPKITNKKLTILRKVKEINTMNKVNKVNKVNKKKLNNKYKQFYNKLDKLIKIINKFYNKSKTFNKETILINLQDIWKKYTKANKKYKISYTIKKNNIVRYQINFMNKFKIN